MKKETKILLILALGLIVGLLFRYAPSYAEEGTQEELEVLKEDLDVPMENKVQDKLEEVLERIDALEKGIEAKESNIPEGLVLSAEDVEAYEKAYANIQEYLGEYASSGDTFTESVVRISIKEIGDADAREALQSELVEGKEIIDNLKRVSDLVVGYTQLKYSKEEVLEKTGKLNDEDLNEVVVELLEVAEPVRMLAIAVVCLVVVFVCVFMYNAVKAWLY